MFDALITAYGMTPILYMFGLLVFLSVAGLLMALFGFQVNVSAARRLIKPESQQIKRTALGQDRRKEIQDQLRQQEDQRKKSTEASLSMMMERAGVPGKPSKLYVKFTIIGAVVTAALIWFGTPPMFALAAFPFCIIILPKKSLRSKIKKIHKKFIAGFPDALDVLVRGVRTGLPVNEGMRLVSREMAAPVGSEFGHITDATSVGVTLDDALERFYLRMPLPEVNFFKIVLTIQKQTGGNLSEALGNLSNTLRERKKLKMKIQALSSEAKASAGIIGSLPVVLGLVLYAVAPDYISLLFTTETGHMMLAAGAVWMGIGIFVMKSMIDIDI